MIGTIENKALEAIRLAELDYRLHKVESYGGEFADGIEKHARDFPSIFAVFEGAEKVKATNTQTQWRASWLFICCAKNLRNEVSARQGSDDRVGSYGLANPILHVREEQAAGTNGGSFNNGSWQQRVLNTVVTNEITGASLSSNQFVLPAGVYRIKARAPAQSVNRKG